MLFAKSTSHAAAITLVVTFFCLMMTTTVLGMPAKFHDVEHIGIVHNDLHKTTANYRKVAINAKDALEASRLEAHNQFNRANADLGRIHVGDIGPYIRDPEWQKWYGKPNKKQVSYGKDVDPRHQRLLEFRNQFHLHGDTNRRDEAEIYMKLNQIAGKYAQLAPLDHVYPGTRSASKQPLNDLEEEIDKLHRTFASSSSS